MNIQKTIQYLNDKIAEIATYANMRANDMPLKTKVHIAALANRFITVIRQVIGKIEDPSLISQYESLNDFLKDIIVKCDSATAYTRSKIDEAVYSAEDDRIKEVRQHITKTINEIRDSEEVKDILVLLKEVTSSLYSQIQNFMSLPETKVAIAKAKISTVKIAEKGVIVLKKLLDVSDEDL